MGYTGMTVKLNVIGCSKALQITANLFALLESFGKRVFKPIDHL